MVNIPEVPVVAAATKDIAILFRFRTTEEDREVIKENIHLYNATTGEVIYLTDDNLKKHIVDPDKGCYYYEFVGIPSDNVIQVINNKGMVVYENRSETTIGHHSPLVKYDLSVNGVIIDTIYAYGYSLNLPYDGTEAILQKPGYTFAGWFNSEDENAMIVALPNNGEIINDGNDRVLYAKWDVEEHEHIWSDEWSNNELTHWNECLKEGCDELGNIRRHSMTVWTVTKEATFTEKGSRTRNCTVCDYVETEEIPATNENHVHDYTGEEETVKEPTCTEKGTLRTHCFENDCSSYIDEDIDPLDHLWVEDEWKNNDTHHFEVCERCPEHNNEEVHEFGDWVVVREATKEQNGLEKCECEICDYEKTREIEYVEEVTSKTTTEETTTSVGGGDGDKDDDNKDDNGADEEPPLKTGDFTPIQMYATLAMISGLLYVLIMFSDNVFGMSEEQKKDIVDRLIRWAKNKSRFRKIIALTMISVVLLYYHAIGKKISAKQVLASVKAN